MTDFLVRALSPSDAVWVRARIADHWGAAFVVVHSVVYYPDTLPGFAALEDGRVVGLLTYTLADDACEIVSIDSERSGRGIGTALIDAAVGMAGAARCRRVWLITTNDNLDALRFYQRRGFRLVAVYPNAVEAARLLKPQIPLVGDYGIPIRDELELEMPLQVP
ncbi:MAG: GNAT family N-acetyltransferase [Anaerolineae bacterium]